MLLDKIKFKTSDYLYLERYINDGSPSGFSEITSSQPTKAKSLNQNFHLVGLSFSDNVKIQDYGEKPVFMDRWQMLAHPDMIYRPENNSLLTECTKYDLEAILVSPTACIVQLADSASFKVSAFNKLCSGFTVSCFESPTDTIHANRYRAFKKEHNLVKDNFQDKLTEIIETSFRLLEMKIANGRIISKNEGSFQLE